LPLETAVALPISPLRERLQAVGLSSSAVAQQLQFLLSGVPVTTVREDIRTVQVVARSAGEARLDPARIGDFTLAGAGGRRVPLSQLGEVDVRAEEPIIRRRDRMPTITVRGDIAEDLQPPDVSAAISRQLEPIVRTLPGGYRIEEAGSIEESGKATTAMLPLFPIMLSVTLLILILQVRSMACPPASDEPPRSPSSGAGVASSARCEASGRPCRRPVSS
jgi:multidrug efflux pump subunit AcrB